MDVSKHIVKVKRKQDEYKELFKLVDNLCKKCYGKGYASVTWGTTASTDLPDHLPLRRSELTPLRARMEFCTCERGDSLKNIIKLNYTPKP